MFGGIEYSFWFLRPSMKGFLEILFHSKILCLEVHASVEGGHEKVVPTVFAQFF